MYNPLHYIPLIFQATDVLEQEIGRRMKDTNKKIE
ncbi:hypothetical protein W909_03660 [Dickeya zeae EC1]|nr:hypothetical protein W909_03660 [Dickeya zeae EC1]